MAFRPTQKEAAVLDSSDDKWSLASLHIISTTMGTADITRMLNAEPTGAFEQGTPINSRNPGGPLRPDSAWILDSGLTEWEPLEAKVMKLLEFCEQNRSATGELARRCEFALVCAFAADNGQGSFFLEATVMRRLAAIPLDLELHLYPPASPDPDSWPSSRTRSGSCNTLPRAWAERPAWPPEKSKPRTTHPHQ